MKSDFPARPPEDFAKFLRTEPPFTVVGGQAVMIWARLFPEAAQALTKIQSRDLDILGKLEEVRKLEQISGSQSSR